MVVEQLANAKAKVAWQASSLAQKGNAHCPHDNKSLKHEEFNDRRDDKAEKNHFLLLIIIVGIAASLVKLWISF